METAPLTLAQTHARNAALETKRANPVAASEEHDLAAAEFATAAQLTKDNEALRILNLLEQHHKKLGQILKSRHTIGVQEDTSAADVAHETSKSATTPSADTGTPTAEVSSQPPRLVRTGRPTARDLSSSIASNLASARGIPSHRQKRSTPISPLVSNQHADGRFSQDEDGTETYPSRKPSKPQLGVNASSTSNRPSWAPPADVSSSGTKTSDTTKADPTASDAPFQQFYSTFESLISKLSAPLAFAGLPLNSPIQASVQSLTPPPPPPKSQTSKSQPQPPTPAPTQALDASVNYSQLISRAALRAVSRNDKSSPYHNPSESFYVVPTSGGTSSYADIMTRADREASYHRRNTSNLSTDDFEDASSTILPAQPNPPSRPGLSNERKHDGKTMEELSLENKALKHLSDTLSKRLHVFEMSAQSSSAALAQSIRSLHFSPLNTPENSRGKSHTTTAFTPDSPSANTASADAAKLKFRVTELEEILKKSDAKARKREEENAKLRDTLGKYRDKWDSLKAGAKARRERVVGEAVGLGKGKERGREGSDTGTGTGTGTEKDETDGDTGV